MENDMNNLGRQILTHWRMHRPEMVEELKRTNQLEPVLREIQEQTGDLLYQLTVVQKMEYRAAWELVTQEWAFLPEEDLPNSPPPPLEAPAEPTPEPSLSAKPSPSQLPSPPAISE